MHNVDLSRNVTVYGQEICYWCGAASAQMSRNGYPNPADRAYYTQTSLWNTIQTYNTRFRRMQIGPRTPMASPDACKTLPTPPGCIGSSLPMQVATRRFSSCCIG